MSDGGGSTIEFVPHCDEPCGLGSAWFECPACHRKNRNYGDMWFGPAEGKNHAEDECEHCGVLLVADWVDYRGEWQVRVGDG